MVLIRQNVFWLFIVNGISVRQIIETLIAVQQNTFFL